MELRELGRYRLPDHLAQTCVTVASEVISPIELGRDRLKMLALEHAENAVLVRM